MIEGLVLVGLSVGFWLTDEIEQQYREQAVAIRADYWVAEGVMDESERKFFFTQGYQLESHDETMENRQRLHRPDTPAVTHVLPPKAFSWRRWEAAVVWVRYLETRLEYNLEPAFEQDLTDLLVDAKWRRDVYSDLADCESTYGHHLGKRLLLQRVRDRIGKENFDLGKYPDHLPPAAYNSPWRPFDPNELP